MSDRDTIWKYQPAAEFAVPGSAVTDTGRSLRKLWRAVVGSVRKVELGADPPEDTAFPPEDVLAAVLPRVDVEAAASGLAAALEDWPENATSKRRARVVVGPPGVPTARVIETLARRRGWGELGLATRSDLLDRPDELQADLQALVSASRPVVIAAFDRWLLRSERTLPLMRQLLGALRDAKAPVLIGCDSWAWSFLDHTVGIDDLADEPLALAAFDAPALAAWLGPPFEAAGVRCRSLEEPHEVLFGPPDATPSDAGEDAPAAVDTMSGLASASRGNPGVALELWKRSLSLDDDEGEVGPDEPAGKATALWAAEPHEAIVTVPSDFELVHDFVLHAVLLHGGLEREMLPEILGFPRHDLLRGVRELASRNLLEEGRTRLSVPMAAYPAVRRVLDSEGLLVDGF